MVRARTILRLLGVVGIVAPPLLVRFGMAPAAVCLVTVLVCMFWLFWAMRARAAGLMIVVLAVVLAGTVLSGPAPNLGADNGERNAVRLAAEWADGDRSRSDLPIVVHIVLDEMVSTGAMTDELDGGRALREALYESATAHGMRTFDSVYSRRYYSGVSLPNLMNAEFDGRTAASQLTSEIQEVVKDNAYFADMARRGYRTAVFQTAIMDFCASNDVRMCQTFRSFDPAEGIRLGRSTADRALSLSETLLRTYEPGYIAQFGLSVLSSVYGVGGGDARVQGSAGRYDPQGFVAWFNHFAAFVERAPRGTHVFAHFLVPHAPYLLGADCQVRGSVMTGYSLASRVPDENARRLARLRYYADYLRQAACVMSRIDVLLGRLDTIEAFRDATIVIHGDHGSRISNGFRIEDLGPRDLVDNYATYFAVRAPGVTPGVDCDFTSLPQVFRRLMGPPAGEAALDSAPLPVLVATRAAAGARVEVPMPRFGCAAGQPSN